MSDLADILKIYETAREFMRESGNPNQWKDSYPPEELVKKDIQSGHSYVCVQDEELVGTFYFAIGEDPSYRKLLEGSWLNEEDYAVIHRVASSGKGKGFAKTCFDWAGNQYPNLKIDTHEDNHVMQHVLEKNGFIKCGITLLPDGSRRLVYQRRR